MENKQKLKPSLVVSRCFLNQNCRYNGEILLSNLELFLNKWFLVVDTCPETEIGLPTPRPPIDVFLRNNKSVLLDPKSKKDYTLQMKNLSESKINSFSNKVDGFLLKSSSPSCGIIDTPIYSNLEKNDLFQMGSGLFAKSMKENYFNLPFSDENCLENPRFRELFFLRVYALFNLRTQASKSLSNLCIFHLKYSNLLFCFDSSITDILDDLVLFSKEEDFFVTYNKYKDLFLSTINQSFSEKNILETFERFYTILSEKDEEYLKRELEEIVNYKLGFFGARKILAFLLSKMDINLGRDAFLTPYPEDLEKDYCILQKTKSTFDRYSPSCL